MYFNNHIALPTREVNNETIYDKSFLSKHIRTSKLIRLFSFVLFCLDAKKNEKKSRRKYASALNAIPPPRICAGPTRLVNPLNIFNIDKCLFTTFKGPESH